VAQGIPVSASVLQWSPLHPRVLDLRARGVELWVRPHSHSPKRHAWHWLTSKQNGPIADAVAQLVDARPPALIVLSDGGPLPPIELVAFCAERHLPFVTIGQANFEAAWRADDIAERYRAVLPAARRSYFVSQANLRLVEKQIGLALPNAEVVWNPVNVAAEASPPWPPLDHDGVLHLASVGRLHPPSKGQDILIEALADPAWKARRWRLSLYGTGPMRQGLERLVQKVGLSDRVVFAGFAAVEDIWTANHVLVTPSRYEGLPLAIVEAMLCARPVVATDVAGHSEVIDDGVTGFLADAPTVRSVAHALERFWDRRHEAESMGKAGAHRIRRLRPADPIHVFTEKLKHVAALGEKN
jgi:glycosyltransferase involved in cell wall biosynthesis